MIRQCAILFGCLALGELILNGYQTPLQHHRHAAAHPFLKIRLDKTALGAGDVRFFSSQPGLFLHSARCGPYALF